MVVLFILISRTLAVSIPIEGRIADRTEEVLEPSVEIPDPKYAYPAPIIPTESNPVPPGPTVIFMPAPVALGIVFDTQTFAVIHVVPGSAADQAGLRVSDRLLAWKGSPIGDLADRSHFLEMKQSIADAAEARGANLTVERQGEQVELFIIPASLPFPPAGWDSARGVPPTVTPVVLPYSYL
jgi:predicted metalloprotease with PDZ domain